MSLNELLSPEISRRSEVGVVAGIIIKDGTIQLEGYPEGSSVHGIDGPLAKELRRLLIFRSELEKVDFWLSQISKNSEDIGERAQLFEALADAALLAFCRWFDLKHPLRPLKRKRMLSIAQRADLKRLVIVRNKLVAHDEHLSTGVYSLIVQNVEKTAIEAVSLSIRVPFMALGELELLRPLSACAALGEARARASCG